MANTAPSNQEYFELLLARFSEWLAAPSDTLPSTRCVSRQNLLRILGSIRKDVAESTVQRRIPASELLARLEHSNIVSCVPIKDPESGLTRDKVYAVGLGAREMELDPVELMTGFQPRSVICYFTALHFHSLTTQVPSHHHFAVVSERPLPPKPGPPPATTDSPKKRVFDPLGTPEFTYRGLRYYRTQRDRRLIPGVQTRHLNDKTLFQITTREQTLIDTLHRPMSCGGPAVVFEAWAGALDDLNEKRLATYLKQIGDSKLWRRVGFVLENQGYVPGRPLLSILEQSRENEETEVVPLLPGIAYSNVNLRWRVQIP